MTHIDFFLDPGQPGSWLIFHELPQALQGLSYAVRYWPVPQQALSAWPMDPVQQAHAWEQAHRRAQVIDLPLVTPAHGADQAPWLCTLAWRMVATGPCPNRFQMESLLRCIWADGTALHDPTPLLQASGTPSLQTEATGAHRLREAIAHARTVGVSEMPALHANEGIFSGARVAIELRAALAPSDEAGTPA